MRARQHRQSRDQCGKGTRRVAVEKRHTADTAHKGIPPHQLSVQGASHSIIGFVPPRDSKGTGHPRGFRSGRLLPGAQGQTSGQVETLGRMWRNILLVVVNE